MSGQGSPPASRGSRPVAAGPRPRRSRFPTWPLLPLLGPGCLPLGLGGEVGGEELSFVEVTYGELRGIDPGTSTPIHEFGLWLMPLEDSCVRFGALLDALVDLREQLGFGLSPQDYCEQWEALWEEHTGVEPFWVGHFRLSALPRAEDETPETTYDFFDEQAADHPDRPHWDADLAWYPTPDFDACATEFDGDTLFAPDLFAATGGEVQVTTWRQDELLEGKLLPEVEQSGDDPVKGRFRAEHCPQSLDWPLEFGLGL